ncbi:hypothetical protein GR223_05290 [Rhizobium leguminosarum]|uniref:hypothetical protein n=1 Tax=Rhizobium ruizarguesonis TaxID=2081791 RepID=UPI0013DE8D95|nr:hypothetical protein [Rhizobium ruizarguesonis]NEJ85366.1 hypothetical protein [Rhizobium ruizarguesonis]
MAETSEIFRELVARYEDSVREKKDKLADYRRQAEAYTSFLESEIAEDQERLDRLRAELASIETSKAHRPAPPIVVSAPRVKPRPPKAEAPVSKHSEKPAGNQSELIRRTAKEILTREGRPLMQSQLYLKMQEMGVEIISTDPKELIRSALKGGDEFRHISGQGWALADS